MTRITGTYSISTTLGESVRAFVNHTGFRGGSTPERIES